MSTATDIDSRLARLERIVGALGAERYGAPGLGPMDPSTRMMRDRVRRDLAQIAHEQAQAPLETREAT